jgi:uncharacterized protein YcbX
VETGPSGFDPAAPAYLPKIRFVMLMRNARLAGYATTFEDATGTFSVSRAGRTLGSAPLFEAEGRARIGDTFADELRGPSRILSSPGHSFSDCSLKPLHLVNLASVRALEERLDRRIDPLRFRPNIVIDGAGPFAELGWIGRKPTLPCLLLSGERRTERCAATNVESGTGGATTRSRALMRLHGHADFGIYVGTAAGGAMAVGNAIDADALAPSPA